MGLTKCQFFDADKKQIRMKLFFKEIWQRYSFIACVCHFFCLFLAFLLSSFSELQTV